MLTTEPPGEADEALDVEPTPYSPKRRKGVHRWLSKNRRPVVVAHRWLGIVLALWIVIEGVTGSILVFEQQIDQWSNSSAYATTHGDVGLTKALESVKVARPGEPIGYALLPGQDDGPVYKVGTVDTKGDPHTVTVDPGSGRVNSRDYHPPAWMEMAQRWHFNLNSTEIFGVLATTILGWLGIGWLLLLATGFYVWYWPRIRKWAHVVRVRRHRGRFTFNLDLHNPVGMVVIIPMFLVVLTGVNFMFPDEVRDVYSFVTFGQYHEPSAAIATSTPGGTKAITAGEAEKAVAALDPAVRPYYVETPSGSPVAVYTVYANVDPSYFSMVGGEHQVEFSVDQYTGRIVRVTDELDENGVTRAYDNWAYPVHAGTFGGDISRVLWVILGLTPLILGWTGYVMWLTRRRRRSRAPAAAGASSRRQPTPRIGADVMNATTRWAAVAVGIVALAGCGSTRFVVVDGGGAASGATATTAAASGSGPATTAAAGAAEPATPAETKALVAAMTKALTIDDRTFAERTTALDGAGDLEPTFAAVVKVAQDLGVKLKVDSATVAGDQATAVVTVIVSGEDYASGVPVPLVKKDGKWLVTRAGACAVLALGSPCPDAPAG